MCLRPMKLGCVLAMLLILCGACAQQNQPAGTPVDQVWEKPAQPTPAPEPTPTHAPGVVATQPTAPAPSPVEEGLSGSSTVDPIVAVVNGRPIPRVRLVSILIETHGLTLLEQLILLTAAEQRAAQMGVKITPEDVAAEHEDALRRIAMPMGGEGAPLDRPAAERLLAEFLAAKNLSATEWDLRMRQRACVRKIAEADVAKTPLTEPMLREEYGLAFGERVQIRHVQVSSLAVVARVKAALEKPGADFGAIAREMSENQITAASGGQMPPFTKNETDVPILIRDLAFRMKAGEVSSAVQQDNWYHIIKVERRFPASGVSFENADREMLKKRLAERLTRQRQETLEVELYRSANVDVRDEGLRKQFKAKRPK